RNAGPDAGSLYLFVRRLDALSMTVRSALSYLQRRAFGLFAFVREKIAFRESKRGADDGPDSRITRWNRLLEYVRQKVPRREHLSLDRFGKLYRIKSRPVFYNIAYSFGIPILLLALTPLLFRTIRKEYTSPLDSGDIEASVDLETGTHLQRTQEILNEIEVMLSKHPAVAEVNAKVEKWHATLNLKTDPEYRRGRSTEDIIAELRQLTDSIEEAFVYYNVAAETGGSRELDIEFYGDNIPEMKTFAREMSTRIQGRVEGIEQAVLRFRESKTDMVLIPRRAKLAMNETTVTEVGSTLRQLLAGAVITKFYDREREVDVRFRAEEEYVDTPDEVRGLMLPLPGRSLPLSSIVNFTEGEGETRIWRKNKRKSVMITLKIRDRSIDEVALDVEELFREVQFPGDTIYAFGDEYRKLKENQRQMLVAIALSILIIYLLLGALFESFSQPLIILITVPLTITGVLFLLALTRMALNMSVYIGLIMLGGIVVNNAILVVSTINQRLRDTQRRKTALIAPLLRSASMRLRPIFMTTLTTICGMLPMVVDYSEGSGLWRPLAITVSFGLTFSLFVSLVMVPFASYLFYRIKTGVDAGGSG
ncbi:MAG: efflux RND transporter permease subunit, partial [Leptospiraceae bacterium]|nr:efflux RND transporter permease subunit [Leptospiraceae bacterium]